MAEACRGAPAAWVRAIPFLNTNLPAYDHDLAKAGTLLDELALKDGDGDGVRELPDGTPLVIELVTSSSDSQQAQLVQEYLRAAGLTVEITSVDQPTSDARASEGDYQPAIVHFGGLSSDPRRRGSCPGSRRPRRASRSRGSSGTATRRSIKIANEQATMLDPVRRSELVDQMQEILANDLPQLSLYVPDQTTFVDSKVFAGWAYTPGCPPCSATMNKRMLVTGSADPAPSN